MKAFKPILLLISIYSFVLADPAVAKLDLRSSQIVANSSRNLTGCDFLWQWGKKIPELKLANCKSASGQLETLTAIYRVKGRDAAKVEKFLHRQFRMDKLRFTCCYWGNGHNNGFYKQGGYTYSIAMSSPETLEKRWQRIPEFKVRVTKYLTEP